MCESATQLSAPRTGTVDVWLTKLSDVTNELREAYRDFLHPIELKRLQRFLVYDARDQFLVSRTLLHTVLSRYVDVPYHAWTFECNAYGKPHIFTPECALDLKFNISHTNGLVACVVNCDYELGVDIENTNRDIDHRKLAPTVLAPAEILALNELTPCEQSKYFYSLWTLKEAYIKARGTGITLPLDGFWFDLDGAESRVQFTTRCTDRPERWQFSRFDPTPEHTLALAIADIPTQCMSINIRWAVPLA